MKRHPFDPVSLVAGVVFSAIAALYIVTAQTGVDVDARWVLPLMLIGLGVGGVVGALTTASRQRRGRGAELNQPDAGEQEVRSGSAEDLPGP